jgi:hypothetical protein
MTECFYTVWLKLQVTNCGKEHGNIEAEIQVCSLQLSCKKMMREWRKHEKELDKAYKRTT